MGSASKPLAIVGVVIMAMLLLGAGMFVLNDSNDKITDSISAMSTQEIDAHNNQYILYEGSQSGSKIKSLVSILISNSKTNSDETVKIPGVYLQVDKNGLDTGIPIDGDTTSYKSSLEQIRKQVDTKHDYWIELSYQDNGLVDYLTISYDENDSLKPVSRKK